jgi:hypothetical protein
MMPFRRGCVSRAVVQVRQDGVPKVVAIEPGRRPHSAIPADTPPGSNQRPSPWQGPDEDVHGDANNVKQAESLPVLPTVREPVLLADAAECTPFTDARLTETFV